MAEGSQDIILNVAGNTRQLERDIQRVASSNLILNTKGFSQPLGKITGQLGEFEKSLAASNARVIAFGVSAGAIYAVEKAFTSMVKSTISVEKSLAEINTILNTSQANLSKFGNQLFDLAKNTGQSFDTVAKSALEFSRQGLGVAETLKRTSDALILTRLSGLDVVSSTESITAALNSFNQTAISSNELVNKLIAVDTGFAVSSADLAEAIKRVGSSAQDAGVGLDELVVKQVSIYNLSKNIRVGLMTLLIYTCLVHLYSCRTSGVSVSVTYPPMITLPQHITKLGIINRSIATKNDGNKIESVMSGESIQGDVIASEECLITFRNTFNQNGVVTAFIPPEHRINGINSLTIPDALPWDTVLRICEKNQCNGLMVLENFDTNSDNALGTTITSINMARGYVGPKNINFSVKYYWR
ncbi:phage tail tape measure protein, partial [bacterium]|nr:phage tail tape measure protein [Candidatus Elulimicrobium humile]